MCSTPGSSRHEFYEHFYVRSQGVRARVNTAVKKRILMSGVQELYRVK